jgi:hypothetical protein
MYLSPGALLVPPGRPSVVPLRGWMGLSLRVVPVCPGGGSEVMSSSGIQVLGVDTVAGLVGECWRILV